MEALPPDRLPGVAIPSGLPLGTPTTVGVPLVGTHLPSGRTIPLTPFLSGRGNKKKGGLWRDTLQTACQRGCPPLDSRFPTCHCEE